MNRGPVSPKNEVSAGANVYVFRDGSGRVLYVGATRDLGRRLSEHGSKPWWTEVEGVETHDAIDWPSALRLETELIARLTPRYNQRGNSPAGVMSFDQPELMTYEECIAARDHFLALAAAEEAMVEKLRRRCIEVHGMDPLA